MTSEIDEINKIGCWEWAIQSFNGYELCLVGGTDLIYYHVAEARFSDLKYISCPTRMLHATFRPATEFEISALCRIVDIGSVDKTIVIEAETTSSLDPIAFFIVAADIKIVSGTVYYYDREDLKPGERIAEWVKRKS